jgi:DNA end-binding protein Ku
MAAIWKGTIAFGLVSIPIELHPAVKEDRPRFRLLHAKDKSPVHYDRVCQREGKPVAWDELVKGYEYAKGKFVVLGKDDFRAAAVEKTKTVDILDFVEAGAIDDRYFDNSYYALPGTGGDRGYAVLREALRKSGRVGVGKIVLRETQHLAELSVVGDALVLTMMRFATELVDATRFTFPDAKVVRPQELKMADQLVESLTTTWDPTQYKDDYRANLLRIIHAKVEGSEPELVSDEAPQDAHVVDLMQRLKQSLDQRGQRATRAARPRPAARRRKRKAA